MALPRRYNIDTRVFKSGKRNPFLNLADTYDLNDLVSQIVLNTAPGLNQLPLLIRNGLTDTYIQGIGTYIDWGGTLVQNTTVDGLSQHSVTFNNVNDFNVSSSNNIVLRALAGLFAQRANQTTLEADIEFNLRTPNAASRPLGSVLQQINTGDSEVEYTAFGFPLADGLINQSLVNNGAGQLVWQDIITNALSGTEIVSNSVYLGGNPLLRNTIIDGASNFDLSIQDVNNLTLQGLITLNLRTPDVLIKPTGALLRMEAANGQAEYTDYSVPEDAANNPGDILVATTTTSMDWAPQRMSLTAVNIDKGVHLGPITGGNDTSYSVGIPPYMTGWTLESTTIVSNLVAGGAPVDVEYIISTGSQGIVDNNFYPSGIPVTFTPLIPVVLGANDVVSIDLVSGGTNMYGIQILFNFKNA
jgi:hypothetical protein